MKSLQDDIITSEDAAKSLRSCVTKDRSLKNQLLLSAISHHSMLTQYLNATSTNTPITPIHLDTDSLMPATPDFLIQKNTYNATPVLELLVQGKFVMRRISDDYINATHILSLAGLSKGQRTKGLEAFVQVHPTHIKVQGGFSGYQGTWVPSASAIILAKKYNVLSSILELINAKVTDVIDQQAKRKFSVKRLRAPRQPKSNSNTSIDLIAAAAEPLLIPMQTRKRSPVNQTLKRFNFPAPEPELELESDQASCTSYESSLLEHPFSLEMCQTLALKNIYGSESDKDLHTLLHRDAEFDVDMPLDTLGNSALQWAASLSNIPKIHFLLSHNASQQHRNQRGETVIMRVIQSTSAFYAKSFFELLDLLADSVYHLDSRGQSVWHHLVRSFADLRCVGASKYYLGIFCRWVAKRNATQWDLLFLNAEDDEGMTAYALAREVNQPEVAAILGLQGAFKG